MMLRIVILLLALGSTGALALEPLLEGQGRIDQLNFGDNTLVIAGRAYRVPVDVQVTIAGSYGAFTMLEPGMPVRIEYRVMDGTRVLQTLRQLPDSHPLDES